VSQLVNNKRPLIKMGTTASPLCAPGSVDVHAVNQL
jgi:hypothetical protein